MKILQSKTSSICIATSLLLLILAVTPSKAIFSSNGTERLDIFELEQGVFFGGVITPVGDYNSTFYLVLWDDQGFELSRTTLQYQGKDVQGYSNAFYNTELGLLFVDYDATTILAFSRVDYFKFEFRNYFDTKFPEQQHLPLVTDIFPVNNQIATIDFFNSRICLFPMLEQATNSSGDCTILNFNMSLPRFFYGKHVPQTDIVVLMNLQDESLQEFNVVSKTLSNIFPQNSQILFDTVDSSTLQIAKLHPENIKNYDVILFNIRRGLNAAVSVIGESDVTNFELTQNQANFRKMAVSSEYGLIAIAFKNGEIHLKQFGSYGADQSETKVINKGMNLAVYDVFFSGSQLIYSTICPVMKKPIIKFFNISEIFSANPTTESQ